MRKIYIFVAWWVVFSLGCATSNVISSAQTSYRVRENLNLKDGLAMLSVMAAGSSSFSDKAAAPKIAEAPYSPARIVEGAGVNLPNETSIDGFCNIANDILVARLVQQGRFTIIPPKQTQSIIGKSDVSVQYREFLHTYKHLGASPEFLKRAGVHLNSRYLLVPQLVVVSNVSDNLTFFIWSFGKRATEYSVSIIANIWDMSTGELVWTGRGTASTIATNYDQPASFDELAGKTAEEIVNLLP